MVSAAVYVAPRRVREERARPARRRVESACVGGGPTKDDEYLCRLRWVRLNRGRYGLHRHVKTGWAS